MDQTLILVDEKDKFLGYAGREECHSGKGKRHRAFVTALFDKNGQILLQKRKHSLFGGLWDLTAISHPLHLEGSKGIKSIGGNKGLGYDESYQEASDRAIKKEMGIAHVAVEKVGGFSYFAKQGKNCENEYCAVLMGEYNGKVKPSRDEVYEVRWVEFEKLIKEIEKNPKKYTVWAKESVAILQMARALNFKVDLEKFRRAYVAYSKSYFSKRQSAARKYPRLIQRYYLEAEDFAQGGKGLRPYLLSIGYRLSQNQAKQNAEIRKIMPVCLAVELVHNFFLIHDDIIDQSTTRRGKLAMHSRFAKDNGAQYGLSQAILVGDLLLLEALDVVSTSEQVTGSQLATLVQSWIATIYGEGLDVDLSKRRASLEDILEVIDLKTAKYTFVGPLLTGAAIGKMKDIGRLKAIELFGISCGRMFQLRDDVLGVFAEERETGKSPLTDMREGKNTLLIYKTKELASQKMRQELDGLWGNEDATKANLVEVRKIIEASGALAWCEEEIERYGEFANKQIAKITKNAALAQILAELMGYLARRKS